MVELKLEPEI